MSEDVSDEVRSVVRDVLDKGPEDLRGCWAACADAGLLGLAAPSDLGGEGLGPAELAVLVEEAARQARDLPFLEALLCGLVPIVRCLDSEQRAELVAPLVSGDLLVSPAVGEPGAAVPSAPSVSLTSAGSVTGRKVGVRVLEEFAGVRTLLAVTASGPDGPVVVLVDPTGEGVTPASTRTSSGLAEAAYTFTDAPARAVLVPGSGDLLRRLYAAGLLVRGAGLLAGARDLTAGYVKEREQFGRRLAEFQGVAMQAAEVYIASRMVGLVAAEVVRRVATDEPADTDIAVGVHWFGEHGLAALQVCHHLHGGMGVDETYPLPRFFARAKDTARLLGGAEVALEAVPVEGQREDADLELTPAQRAFKEEVRSYFAGLLTREDRVEMMTDRHGPAYHRTIKQMGRDGWMGVGWPTEYGGKGLGGIEQQVFANEAARADVHLPSVTLQTVGPTLQAFGTELQKEMFLPRILTGDVHFAIGYSEAEAGTDLASLRTTARRETDERGEHFVVNGQKMWTTGGHAADYVWLAVRTDPAAPRHKGISVLIVDTSDPGYSWTPIVTSDGSHHVNATYYNDVRVPVEMLVGEENDGWRLITTQLNHERVMLAPAGRLEGLRDLVLDWASPRVAPDGRSVADQPDVRRLLAQVTATFRVNELLNWQVCEATASGAPAVADASAGKVFASERLQVVGRLVEEVVQRYGDRADPETDELLAYLDSQAKRYLVLTFGGGVNEVQRELVCMFGLGLPKVPR